MSDLSLSALSFSDVGATSWSDVGVAPSTSMMASPTSRESFAAALSTATSQLDVASAPSGGSSGLFVGYEGPEATIGTGVVSSVPAPLSFAGSAMPTSLTASTAPGVATPSAVNAAFESPVPLSTTTANSSPVSASNTAPLMRSSSVVAALSAGGQSSSGAAIVNTAQTYLGTPYVWGGTTPAGFDCSGLVQYVYARWGIHLPRTSQEQATAGQPISSLASAQPGDLLFFAGSDGTASSPGHVAIYAGGNEMIDAPYTGAVVRFESIANAGPIVAIRRVLNS